MLSVKVQTSNMLLEKGTVSKRENRRKNPRVIVIARNVGEFEKRERNSRRKGEWVSQEKEQKTERQREREREKGRHR